MTAFRAAGTLSVRVACVAADVTACKVVDAGAGGLGGPAAVIASVIAGVAVAVIADAVACIAVASNGACGLAVVTRTVIGIAGAIDGMAAAEAVACIAVASDRACGLAAVTGTVIAGAIDGMAAANTAAAVDVTVVAVLVFVDVATSSASCSRNLCWIRSPWLSQVAIMEFLFHGRSPSNSTMLSHC